jgi:4-amino-4-deoxy-L-arabinose transferase-like glycosyltransferase
VTERNDGGGQQLAGRTGGRARASRWLPGLILLGLLGGVLLSLLQGGFRRPYVGDEHDYVEAAVSILEGRGFSTETGRPVIDRTPGLPVFLSAVFAVAGSDVAVARVSALAASLTIIPACYLLGLAIGGPRVATWSAATAAIFPHWLFYASAIMTDVSGAGLLTAGVALVILGRRERSRRQILAAAVLGALATLTRPTCLVFGPMAALWLAFGRGPWGPRLGDAVSLLLPFLLLLAPWCVRTSGEAGHFVLLSTKSEEDLWIGNNPLATGILFKDHAYFKAVKDIKFPEIPLEREGARAARFKSEALAYMASEPGRTAELAVIRFGEFWKVYSARMPMLHNFASLTSVLPVMLLALLTAIRFMRSQCALSLLVMLILAFSLMHSVYPSIVRYRIPIEPLLLVMAVHGVSSWLGGRREPAPEPR